MILQRHTSSRLCVTNGLWFLGDDSLYYRALVTLDSGLGAYLWTTRGPEACPDDSTDISDSKTGSTFWLYASADSGGDGLYHAFRMTPLDTPTGEEAALWTDYTQQANAPRPYRTIRNARVDGDLYLVDTNGYQHHAMTMITALFSERTQGFTVPV